MSNKIPTALELLKNKESYDKEYPTVSIGDAVEAMIEFAKLHVKAALKAVNKNITTTCLADRFLDGYDFNKDSEGNIFNENSILNAYPEKLIK